MKQKPKDWHRLSMFKKRLHGFACYQLSSWLALFIPEAVDRIMYKTLREQYDSPQVSTKGKE